MLPRIANALQPRIFPATEQRSAVEAAYRSAFLTAQADKQAVPQNCERMRHHDTKLIVLSDQRASAVNHFLIAILQIRQIERQGRLQTIEVHAVTTCLKGTGITMETVRINQDLAAPAAANDFAGDMMIAQALASAAAGDASGYFDLGVAFSTGSHGVACDLVEAHKWFNLAAVGGHDEAAVCRAEVADDMTAREIAEAQRRARQWLGAGLRKAA